MRGGRHRSLVLRQSEHLICTSEASADVPCKIEDEHGVGLQILQRYLVEVAVGERDDFRGTGGDDGSCTPLDVDQFHLPEGVSCMQCGDDARLFLVGFRLPDNGYFTLNDEMNAVVWFSLFEQGGVGRNFLLDKKGLDQEQLVFGQPSEHAVFAEKFIVYRAFAHTVWYR